MCGHTDPTSPGEGLALGIEGGGTKTEWALISADRSVLKEGLLPPANFRFISDEALLRMFHVLPGEVTHVGVFLAGCANQADRARLHELTRSRWPAAEVAVGSDRDSGFATAFGAGDGVTVIAGTGSAVTGRCGAHTEKAGGWGQLLGDKGGGYNLAVQALRRVLSDYDIDHRVDPLGEIILRALCLNQLEELVNWASHADKMSVAKLAPVVFQSARAGHKEMLAALHGGAQILAVFTRAVAQRLGLTSPEVRLSGGLFIHHAQYEALFRDHLRQLLPDANVSVCRESGALGSAWLAWRKSGGPPEGPGTFVRRVLDENPLPQLAAASTEQRNPRSAHLDQLSTDELVDLFVAEETHVTEALRSARKELVAAVELISTALRAGGRLFYVGAGTSGRLGVLDASEIPPTFGVPADRVQGIIAGGATALHSAVEGAEDQCEAAALAVAERGVTAGDVVCGITASGRTPFVLAALARAREIGAKTLLLTCNPARPRGTLAAWSREIDLPTGAEIVTGSTRLKAGTATKVALNILSTCAMVRLGKVSGHLMVDVRVSNAKLRDRAARLVREARGCSYEEACALLAQDGWNVRAAIDSKP
ncbi:MAG: N-acetylmuramic acid 6-phosphate etherase [Chthoniobacterales bacterium]